VQGVELFDGRRQQVTDGGRARKLDPLRQKAYGAVRDDRAAVRTVNTCGQPEQRGLARPVLADETETLAGSDDEVNAVENEPVAEAAGDVVQRELGMRCGDWHVGP
jgi:hypothetical protein